MASPYATHEPCRETGAAAQACPESAKPWILAVTILGSSLAFIEASVVNIALPVMQRSLDATAPEMQWVVNAYLLLLGALMLTGGAAGDHFGRRRVFVFGTVLFAAGALAAGLAPGTTTLIVARAVQGVGGAFLVPSSLALITTWFGPDERGKAIGTWAGFSALTTAGGPLLGGWLVDALSWRWVFLAIVPLAALTVLLTLARVPADKRAGNADESLDIAGAILVTAGLAALTYAMIAAGERGWAVPPVIAAGTAGLAALAAFLWWERRRRAPMMPLRLFRSPAFSGANLLTVFLYFALAAAFFFLPFNLVQVQGWSATAAGAAFLPFTLVMGFFSRYSGALADRIEARWLLGAGSLIAALGLAALALPPAGGGYWTAFFPGLMLLGVGMTAAVAPLTTVVMNSVGDDDAGKASGINNTAARVAGLLAVALLGALAVDWFGAALATELEAAGIEPALRESLLDRHSELAALAAPEGVAAATRSAVATAVDQAFLNAFERVMLLSALLAAVGGIVGFLSVGSRRGQDGK